MTFVFLVLSACLLLRALPSIHAAPAPAPANTTSEDQYLGWHSQPNVRGTWDILVNCVVTMSLCIWTALHLNLPRGLIHDNEPWIIRLWHNQIFRQIRWVFMGLIAPELVVHMAWSQRRQVADMNEQVKTAQELVSLRPPSR